ncbi:MAG: hypothetical protein Q3M24_19205 [Candidatus Electrothrix aestuarii]|uniref:LTD domain-containing protein n=1 Tax=Candidatus Electrothrix aestuarii TaxID=3062594 RepID=A0AAU8LTQ0_9BACT
MKELDIRAGAWGKASFSAMARGHLEIYGSLADPKKSGFIIECGGSIGLSAGTGWDLFAIAHLNNPDRFYTRTIDLITYEIITTCKEKLPAEYHPIVELVDFCLPSVFQLCMVAGQATSAAIINNSEKIAGSVVEALTRNFKRYVLRKLISAGQTLIEELINDMVVFITRDFLDDKQREDAKKKIKDLINWLKDNSELNLNSFIGFSAQFTDIMSILLPDAVRLWREPITVIWCGLAITHVIDEIVEPVSGNISGIGFSLSGELAADDLDLGNVPDIVLDEIESLLGTRPVNLHLSTAIDYLAAGSVAPILEDILPDLSVLLKLMEKHTGVTSGDFVSAVLLGSYGGNLAASDLYIKLKGVLKSAIDEYIDEELLPGFRNIIPQDSQARLYMDEVVEPSLLGCSNFVFERLDGMIAGTFDDIFVDSFRVGVSNLVYKVFARNVVVLGYLITDHVLNNLEDEFNKMKNDVKKDRDHLLVTLNSESIKALSLQLVSDETADKASQKLIVDLLSIGQKAFGKKTWTQKRRERLRHVLLAALVNDSLELDYRNKSVLEDYFVGILECNHVPNASAVKDLTVFMSEITLEQIAVLITELPPALTSYYLALSAETLEKGYQIVKEAVGELEETAQEMLKKIEKTAKNIHEFSKQVRLAAQAFANELKKIEKQFKNEKLREKILDNVWKESTKDIPFILQYLPGITYKTFIRPLLDLALQAVGEFVGCIADGIKDTVHASDLIGNVSKLIIQGITREIESVFKRALKIEFPKWLIPVNEMASVANTVFLEEQSIKSAIERAYRDETDERNAKAQRDKYEKEKKGYEKSHSDKVNFLEKLKGKDYSVRIESPRRMSTSRPEKNLIHAAFIPIKISIEGINSTFLAQGKLRRVFITINEKRVKYVQSDWRSGTNGFTYHKRFQTTQDPIKRGINILECSVIDIGGEITTRSVSFIVDPKSHPTKVEPIDIGWHGDLLTHIVLENKDIKPVNLAGWKLQGEKEKSLSLPEHTLMPGKKVRLVSDLAKATKDDIVLDAKSARLRNIGSEISLIDKHMVLHSVKEK